MENENFVYLSGSHTVSEDQAVMLMLGFKGDFFYELEGELHEYSLREYLNDKQEAADAEYSNALYDLHIFKEKMEAGAPEDEQELRALKDAVAEKKTLLDKTHELVALAQEYVYLITDEVAKLKNGPESPIRLDPDETKKMGCNQITKNSFFKWRDQILQIKPEQEVISSGVEVGKSMSGVTAQKNNEITTFLLAQALAMLVDKAREKKIISQDSDKNGYPRKLVKKDGTLNIAGLVRYLLENTTSVGGQEDRSLKKRLGDAQKLTSPEDIASIGADELKDSLYEAEYQWDDLDLD